MADNKITVTLTAKNDLSGSLASAGRELQEFASKADAIGSRFEAAGLRIGAMGLAANAGLSRLGLDLKSVVDSSVDAQKALFGIASTAGINGAAAEAIAGKWSLALDQIAKQTNQTKSQLITAFQDMVAKGISEQDALKMLAPIGKAATATTSSIRDIAVTVSASFSKMEIGGDRVAKVLDVMAAAGDAGAFELKDMAQYMDMLTAKSASLGAKGEASMTQLAAAAQVARMGTGDAASAANNLANWLDKLNASSTANTFKDIGVDLEKLKGNARQSGDFIGYMISEIKKITGGDTAKIAKLFPDVQAGSFAQIATQNFKEYVDIAQKAGQATGVVNEKFDTMMRTTSAKLDSVQINLASAIEGSKVVQGLLSSLDGLGKWASEHPEIAGFIGIGAASTAAVGLVGGAVVAGIGATISAIGSLTSAVIGLGGLLVANPVLAVLFGVAAGATLAYVYWDDLAAAAQAGWEKIKAIFADGLDSIKQSFLNFSPVAWVVEKFNSLSQFFSSLPQKWQAAGSEIMEGMQKGISAVLDSLPFGIGGKITEAVKYVGNLARDWWNAGKNLMSSLLDGIKSKYNEIVGSIKRLGQDMFNAIGIKSAAAAERDWTGSFGVMKRPAASSSVAPAPLSLSAPAPKFESYSIQPKQSTEEKKEQNRLLELGRRLTESVRTEEEKYAAVIKDAKQALASKNLTYENYLRVVTAANPMVALAKQLTLELRTEEEIRAARIDDLNKAYASGNLLQGVYNRGMDEATGKTKRLNDLKDEAKTISLEMRTEEEKLTAEILRLGDMYLEAGLSVENYTKKVELATGVEKARQDLAAGAAAVHQEMLTEEEKLTAEIQRLGNMYLHAGLSAEDYTKKVEILTGVEKARQDLAAGAAAVHQEMLTEEEKLTAEIQRLGNMYLHAGLSAEDYTKKVEILTGVEKARQDLAAGAAAVHQEMLTEEEKLTAEIQRLGDMYLHAGLSLEDYTKKVEMLTGVEKARLRMIEEGEALTLEMRTEQEKYADSLEDLNIKLSKGAISQETFNRAVARLGESTAAAKEWQGITRSLTDALLRGFESGKDFGRNFRDTLKNMFNTLILRPIIQPIVQAGANMVLSAIGLGSSATSMAAGLGGGSGGSGIGDALSLASSLKDAWKFASNYFSGSSAAAAAPNYYAVAPLGSTPPGGVAGAAVGNPAMATAAQYLGAAAAGFVIGKMISGGYSALGKSGNAAVIGGTAIGGILGAMGALGGPLGMIVGGAIGGLVNRLFGRKLKEVGIQGTFSGEGFSGEQYRYEKGGLFRSSKTTTSPLDAALDESMDKSYQSLKLSAITLGNVFMDTSKSLDNFSYSIKLNFLGLDAEASNKLIEGELTKMGDAMASVILADISRAEMATAGIATDLVSDVEQYWKDFARAGESSTETLTRLSGSLAGVNGWMDRLGMTMYDTTLAAGDMASELVDLFGSMDKFSQSMQSYTERYYTSAERLQMGTADLQQKFDDLGLTMPGTIEEFRALVEAQDLTTESGRNTYASLIGLNEAFYGVAQAGNFAALNGRTLMEAWTAQTSIVDGLISSYDGSAAAQQTLADAARSRYQIELALVKQIDNALSSTHSMFMSTIDEMKFSTLDTAGKYDFLQAKSVELEGALRASTDPAEIKSLADQLNQVSRDAWMLLGDDEKRIKLDAYEEYLNEMDALTTSKLNAAKQNIKDNGGGQDSADSAIAAAISAALVTHTAKMMEAAVMMKDAADKPVKLEQKVTVDVNVDMPSNVEVGIL